jgi:hypothetical protein
VIPCFDALENRNETGDLDRQPRLFRHFAGASPPQGLAEFNPSSGYCPEALAGVLATPNQEQVMGNIKYENANRDLWLGRTDHLTRRREANEVDTT